MEDFTQNNLKIKLSLGKVQGFIEHADPSFLFLVGLFWLRLVRVHLVSLLLKGMKAALNAAQIPTGWKDSSQGASRAERERDAWVEFSEQLPVTANTDR